MSLSGKPTDHEISQQQQLNINITDKDDQNRNNHGTPKQRMFDDTAKTENESEIKRTPDGSTMNTRILQIFNSVHKKPVPHFLVVRKYLSSNNR